MSEILKPSELRNIINRLNDLLLEYANSYEEIGKSHADEFMKCQREFEKVRNELSHASEKDLKVLEDDFKEKQSVIEKEASDNLRALQGDIENRKESLFADFDSQSEMN